MIRTSILTTAFLLVLYSLFIYLNTDRIKRTGQNQYARNLVSAEEYLYEKGQRANTLILGSSLSTRLLMDSLPHTYYNLGMSGLSVYDGLNLLKKAAKKPKTVLIEMNIVLRDANTGFTEDVFHPALYSLRQYVPVLRKKYQPLGVLKALYRDQTQSVTDTALFTLPKEIYEREVRNIMADFSSTHYLTHFQNRFSILKKEIRELRAKGIKVVFFEMPVYSKASQLKIPRLIRANFLRNFPPHEYGYISLPQEVYQTTDGLHLAGAEARRYTRYIREHMTKLQTVQYSKVN
ncbi:hypothetical protein BWI97_06025 [Siphonobacter sp. BAB-5405]|uniref:hypothetical protein n=1 Tax=Siphonobacter sp. BAB-5405 TaxID=1864825 RepID=UPI000C803B5E|nr:hypothetical protein [Siphonobacter sp. BAB-5405]PMD98237.1 hypothetical protein BWI97_06025 [Siphonobacter sp. BAB-5405]